ncbi:MAG: folylpolyglutamate synthase/dihydrofolate synthase family protein [Planctomycetota bacterium]
MAPRKRSDTQPTPLPGTLAEIKPPQTYAQALALLDHLPNLEAIRQDKIDAADFKLHRMRALLERLGDPHEAFTAVHVAGSKGKGSVASMLVAALAGSGYAVGLHTSPHLVDVRERVRINNTMIDQDSFTTIIGRILQAAAAVQRDTGTLTYFEALVAMAFCYFAEQAVDVAVIEVGLGGRLDATNVITPAVSVISEIQLEHTEILGDTLAKIAAEKAGICKPGVPVVTMPQDEEALTAIEAAAEAVGAPLAVLGRELDFSSRFEADRDHGPHYRIGLASDRTVYEHIAVPLPGEHQARNGGLVLAALDALAGRGFDLPEIRVAEGLEQTDPMGRLETVWPSPRIVVDGAHTPASIRALIATLGACIRYDSMIAVFGCAADKDVDGMLEQLARGADKVVFTSAEGSARSADPTDLAKRYTELTGTVALIEPSVKGAINTAGQAATRDDLVCVTGSFYIAGEAKRLFEAKRQAEPV